MNQDGFAVLHEALRLMTEEQKAKLLENIVQLSRKVQFDQKLEEFEREQQMQDFKIKHF